MKTMRHVYGVSLCASSILTENLTKPIKTLSTRKKRQMKIGRHSILVLSKYAVDCKLFDESGATTSTWEACSLRKWLNETFFNDAFSADEQNLIIETLVTADQCSWAILSQGNDTKDKVFLLSVQEADKYFPTIEEKKCEGTSFALAQSNSGTPDRWWLRTSGESYYRFASCVGSDGLYESKSADLVWSGVRPAIWISLE